MSSPTNYSYLVCRTDGCNGVADPETDHGWQCESCEEYFCTYCRQVTGTVERDDDADSCDSEESYWYCKSCSEGN
jgi:hypothetical protein